MHAANRSIIRELGIVHGHVFPYSPRARTPAARMPQVEHATIRARAAELRAEVAGMRTAWLEGLIGQDLAVLAESDGTGHAGNFARVAVPAGTRPGSIVAVSQGKVEQACSHERRAVLDRAPVRRLPQDLGTPVRESHGRGRHRQARRRDARPGRGCADPVRPRARAPPRESAPSSPRSASAWRSASAN
jgi:hypothetical protein